MSKKLKAKPKAREKVIANEKVSDNENGSKVFNFRVLIESEDEDVIREIEICDGQTFEDFHEAIKKAFNFSGKQMASFYLSNDEWSKGREITLVPMDSSENEDTEEVFVMSETRLKQLIKKQKTKLVYVYDFLLMWDFYIELLSISEPEKRVKYPRIVKKVGKAPAQDSRKIAKLTDEDEELMKEFKADRKSRDVFSDEIFEGFDDFEDGFNDLDDMDGFSELDKF